MNMPSRCPTCGSEAAANAPGGMCPRCLLRQVLEGESAGATAVSEKAASVLSELSAAVGSMPTILLRDSQPGEPASPLIRPSSSEMPTPGERLQLFGEIARGGMGAILKGRDPDLGRELAVKVLLEAHQQRPDLIRRFVEEAQIAGQLQHPGIVPVYELGTFADHRPFFSMKLVKGRTLAELLAERTSPSHELPKFLGIFESICQTMGYSHARGVIHRDLKPSNVMVGSFGEVQVMDWGLAKVLARGGAIEDAEAGKTIPPSQETVIATDRSNDPTDLSQAGSIMGTPSYMAPEQARGEIDRTDERADVFALGSILCEMLTGKPAFTGRSSGEIQRKAALGDTSDALDRLEKCASDRELIDLANSCLGREPEDRPRDAGAVTQAITSHLMGVQEKLRAAELARVAEHARAEQAEATAKAEGRARRLTVALAASVLGLVALGGGGFGWIQWQRAGREAKIARGVDDAMSEAQRFRAEADTAPVGDLGEWSEALAAAKRAEELVKQGEVGGLLRSRVETLLANVVAGKAGAEEKARRAAANRTLLVKLEAIRGDRSEHSSPSRTDRAYGEAFRHSGLDVDRADAETVARWIQGRSELVELASYLDDWFFVRMNASTLEAARRLLVVAMRIDRDPWRSRLRGKVVAGDKTTALEADDDAALDAQPPAGLIFLARTLKHGLKDPKRAEAVLRRARTRFPGDFWANIELANVAAPLRAGTDREFYPNPEEAVRYLTAAVAIRPRSPVAHYNLSMALRAYGKPEEALAEAREADRLRPADASNYINLGNSLKERKKDRESEVEYRRAIGIDPNNGIAHFMLAEALESQGKTAEALAEARIGVRLLPETSEAHGVLGHILMSSGKLPEAEAELHEALRLKPESPESRYWLGRAFSALGKTDDAIAELREAVRLDPNRASIHSDIGICLMDKNRNVEAEAEFRAALRCDPNFAYPHFQLGIFGFKAGDLSEAAKEFREAIRLEREAPQPRIAESVSLKAHRNLGIVLESQGDLAGAAEEYRKSLRNTPEDLVIHQALADIFRRLGDREQEVVELRNVVRLDPQSAQSNAMLGFALDALGKGDQAIESWKEAVRLDPKMMVIHYWLGRALVMHRHEYAEAIEHFREARRLSGFLHPAPADLADWLRRAEAGMIEPRLDAVVKGADKPKDAAEAANFAVMALQKHLPGAAYRLFSEAFAADPKLLADRRSGNRYNASCAALLAASGKGDDKTKPDEAAKIALRKQALEWLRQDLEDWSKDLAANRKVALVTVSHWTKDSDLAGIRDEKELEKLPEAERKQWQALWADVAELLKKAE